MRVHGIGCDILPISRIEAGLSEGGGAFVKRVYSNKEIKLIESRPKPVFSYATRFAGKEAVFKALRINGRGVDLREIEILESPEGCPEVVLHGKLAEKAAEFGVRRILVSLSYDSEYAIAYASAHAEEEP